MYSGGSRGEAETTVFTNGYIYTVDGPWPVEAMAVRNGRIVAVGTSRELSGGANARIINLGERTVIPGLIDAHIHFLSYSRSLNKVILEGVRSKEEVLRMVEEKAKELGPRRWILGGGWNHYLWDPPSFPTRHDLDRVAPNNPVLLDRKDLHSCWVNTLALQAAGINRDTPDPPGAAIGRDADGEPDGLFYESATAIPRRAISEAPEDALTVMRKGFQNLASMGLVGFHDCEGPDAFSAFQHLDAEGELPLRVVILLAYPTLDESIEIGLRTGFGSDKLRVGPVKIFSDGSLGSMTAQMLEPYVGHPDNRGISTIPQEELEEAVRKAAEAGIPAAVHAIGDAANRRVLDAFAKLGNAGGLINRIEHVQHLHPKDIPRFGKLGVVASMQPIHATSDMQPADQLLGTRARYSYAWRSLLNTGALLAFGSDAPVETPNPFAGIHAAVTRQDENDLPIGGWYPEERLTVVEAVRAYTEGAARSMPYLPGVTGMLHEGAVADFLVLDEDIFALDPRDLKAVKPRATVIGGEAVYDPDGVLAS